MINRFGSQPQPDDPDSSELAQLENQDGPIAHLLSALCFAQHQVAPPPGTATDDQLCRDYEATAAEMECSVLTAVVVSLLSPVDRPEFVLMYHEGGIHGPVTLDEVRRDVVQAYVCVVTPRGEWIERGLMQQEEGEWIYRLQEPSDPRLSSAIAFTVALGAPHVNG